MIPCVFRSDDRLAITDEPYVHTAWVTRGEGVARRLYIGQPILRTLEGWYWQGKGHGWVPFEENVGLYSDERGWLWAMLQTALGEALTSRPGVYALCGPDVMGNPEGFEQPVLIKYSDAEELEDVPRDRAGMKQYLIDRFGKLSGILFMHPGGSMAKVEPGDV